MPAVNVTDNKSVLNPTNNPMIGPNINPPTFIKIDSMFTRQPGYALNKTPSNPDEIIVNNNKIDVAMAMVIAMFVIPLVLVLGKIKYRFF
jgi:hypothetical protein